MLALVAMLVIIIAVLFGNRLHLDFSCHISIISRGLTDVKLTKMHKCDIIEVIGGF